MAKWTSLGRWPTVDVEPEDGLPRAVPFALEVLDVITRQPRWFADAKCADAAGPTRQEGWGRPPPATLPDRSA